MSSEVYAMLRIWVRVMESCAKPGIDCLSGVSMSALHTIGQEKENEGRMRTAAEFADL